MHRVNGNLTRLRSFIFVFPFNPPKAEMIIPNVDVMYVLHLCFYHPYSKIQYIIGSSCILFTYVYKSKQSFKQLHIESVKYSQTR